MTNEIAINTITAKFIYQNRQIITRKMYQYDYGQKVLIKGIKLQEQFEAHISNQKDAETAGIFYGNNNEILIPDEYFLSGEDIYIWVYLHKDQEDGATRYEIRIPIQKRPKPVAKQFPPSERETVEEIINKIKENLEQVQAAILNYPKIVDGNWYIYDVDDKTWVDTGVSAAGIKNITYDDENHTITIELENGDTYTTSSLQGERGPQGIQGPQGAPGRGIVSVEQTGQTGTIHGYTITYTDGTTSGFSIDVPTDFNTEYELRWQNRTLTLLGSDSTATSVTIPDNNTTYTLSKTNKTLTLTDSNGNTSSVDLSDAGKNLYYQNNSLWIQ